MVSCRDCPCDSASCRDSRQEAKSHGQSLQEAIYQTQQSRQEASDRGQSRRKPNMRDSLCRKRILADSFIPCVDALREKEQVKKVVAKCLQMKMSVIRFRKRTKKNVLTKIPVLQDWLLLKRTMKTLHDYERKRQCQQRK